MHNYYYIGNDLKIDSNDKILPACLFRGNITVWLNGVGILHMCHLLN